MSGSGRSAGKVFFCILLVIVFVFLGGLLPSYYFLRVNEYELSGNAVDSDVRMVVVSDLHDHEFGEKNERLVEKIREQKPDVIFLVGDILNEDSADDHVPVELVQGLVEVAPVYYALGNHEIEYMVRNSEQKDEQGKERLLTELKEAGAIVLDGAYIEDGTPGYVDITVKNVPIRIGGLYAYAFGIEGSTSEEMFQGEAREYLEDFQNTDSYKIMMSHRPDSFIFGDAAETWKIDLVLSGHDHGGQVLIPGLGGLYGGDQGWFPPYVHGMFELGNINLYVTNGLSSEHQKLPRWNNPPEIAVIDLKPNE